jgi:Phytanoyl-CoA dioxygenase (PhyH)
MKLRDLEEVWPEEATPKPEREPETLLQSKWASDGVVFFEWPRQGLPVLADYVAEWLYHNGGPGAVPGVLPTYVSPGGWDYATPYMDHLSLRRLACDGGLARMLEELTGEPMGVHLNLTGWMSTRRDWHRDQYLNEPYVGGFYAAVWLALDVIHSNAGPFQFCQSSHRGNPISQAKVKEALGPDGAGFDWPTHSERVLTPLFEREIVKSKLEIETYLPQPGHGLIWHGRLLHRGSKPVDPTMERRALIMHFSGIHHRPDFPPAVQHEAGGWYFPLGGKQPVR